MSHQEKKRKHINSLQSLNDAIHWSPSTIRELGHPVAPTGSEQVADACCVDSNNGAPDLQRGRNLLSNIWGVALKILLALVKIK
ncbi:hypothetical protein TNCV_673981 [Trichonephila clavipes]|uniref:Uncharacterized protein n=1 Tax=Trichonephila clavipes TaxID=2585209 RepID=A0A8X7BIR4_TRICX|nr:hypothetical protein TNCV_673981 [Trichonephila clavipes]